jgi:hypothetical protein
MDDPKLGTVLLPYDVRNEAAALSPVDEDEWDAMVGTARAAKYLAPDRVFAAENTHFAAFQIRAPAESALELCDEDDEFSEDACGNWCFKVRRDAALNAAWTDQLLQGVQCLDDIVVRGWFTEPGALRLRGSTLFTAALLDSAAVLLEAAMGVVAMRALPQTVHKIMGFRTIPERFGATVSGREGFAWRFLQWACGLDDTQWSIRPATKTREDRITSVTHLLLHAYAEKCRTINSTNAAVRLLRSEPFAAIYAALQDVSKTMQDQVAARMHTTCFVTANVANMARAFVAAKPPEVEFQRYALAPPTRGSHLFEACVPIYEDAAGAGAVNARARAQGYEAMKRLSLFASAITDVAADLDALVIHRSPTDGSLHIEEPNVDAAANRVFAYLSGRAT